MRAFLFKDENNCVKGFNFSPGSFRGQWWIYKFIKKIPGVVFFHKPIWFVSDFFGEEEFCQFEFNGKKFRVLDMFGSGQDFSVVLDDADGNDALLKLIGYFICENSSEILVKET